MMLDAIYCNLAALPRDLDLVVGLPRSGMIPAYAIGLILNLPVVDLQSFIDNKFVGNGHTRSLRSAIAAPHLARKLLLVDDSCNSGASVDRALIQIADSGYRGLTQTCAAIVTPYSKRLVDFSFLTVSEPRVFQWNLFHHSILSNACLDFDGVLCVDPTDDENDDGENYKRFLLNAAPLHLPTPKVGHIVSARLEKYRGETEDWLSMHGVIYGELHLLDLPNKQERIRTNAHLVHKSEIYKQTNADLFVESNLDQAQHIAANTGLPVFCVDSMQMINSLGNNPGALNRALWRSVYLRSRNVASRYLPKDITAFLKNRFGRTGR